MSAVIKYFHSGLTGAPVLNGLVGTLRDVLDACLVDGWGLATVDSVTISGGIATVTRSAGHPFEPQTVALVSGATVSGSGSINGEQTVLTTTASQYTFATTATGTVSGTVQHKFAPLGFARAAPGTNTAAYQITGSGGTGFWLRVDDTVGRFAAVRGYESMGDVNTGSNAFPTTSQYAGLGLAWGKSNAASSTSRSWSVLGDDRGFYLLTDTGTAAGAYGFGDFNSLKSADGFNCFVTGWSSDYTANVYSAFQQHDIASSYYMQSGTTYIARPYTGTGSPQSVFRQAQFLPMNLSVGQSGNLSVSYPNASDGSLILTPVNLLESSGSMLIRGSLAGILHIAQSCGAFSNRDKVTGVAGYSGRTFRVWTPGAYPMLIDNTGPWR